MNSEHDGWYRALCARDARFDGLFFVGVTTTGIYCRPVCSARTPGRDRCCFFTSAAAAEREGFRPCLRCRPELAPGHAPVDAVRTLARVAAARIEAGALNNGHSLEDLARELGLGGRQLRRSMRRELGVAPVELAQTRRLLLAKQLLTETDLPVARVVHASGFKSVRRFNALFRDRYGLTPSALRRTADAPQPANRVRLMLAYRPPYAWDALLRFLAARCTNGVEVVAGNAYIRTTTIGEHRGRLRVTPICGRDALALELDAGLMPVLPDVLARLRNLFDLDARPDVIAEHLRGDADLGRSLARTPGLRVPGTFDGFELAVRAILGQRVSVRAATTLAGRLATAFGTPFEDIDGGLDRIAPTATQLAEVETGDLRALGIGPTQAAAIQSLARAVTAGEIDLAPGAHPEEMIRKLQELPGIGEWTAQYVAMRTLRWPDAFPAGDLGLLKAAGMRTPRALQRRAEAWRPWRAYAAMVLWESLSNLERTVLLEASSR